MLSPGLSVLNTRTIALSEYMALSGRHNDAAFVGVAPQILAS
jgi:hypothetical protein